MQKEQPTRGERISAFRASLKMTQKEFAQALDLKSHATISNYERHNLPPQRYVVKRMLDLAEKKHYLLTREHLENE